MDDESAAAVRATHEWFERNSGWAAPDDGTMQEWLADGMCRAPDECVVSPTGVCDHGLASWKSILDDQARRYPTERSKRAASSPKRPGTSTIG